MLDKNFFLGRSDANSFWAFGPSDTEVVVSNVECLLPYLPIFLGGWSFRHVSNGQGVEPDILIEERSGGNIYVSKISNRIQFEKFDSEFVASRDLAEKLVAIFIARNHDKVCINASGVLVNDELIVCLGLSDVERNTLALQLTATGHRFFGGQNLLLRCIKNAEISGICLNLPPKVDLPIPKTLNSRYREFVDSFTEITTCNTAYLKLWDGEAASFMEEKPLRAIFILHENNDNPPNIIPADYDFVYKTLLESTQLSDCNESFIVDSVRFVSEKIESYQLSCSKYADAAKCIVETLRTKL